MRPIDYIVLHCADTYAHMDIGRAEIDLWHRQRGWNQIGYHYVIRRDGTLETGRPEEKAGAHAYGYNRNSIGICLVGGRGEEDQPEDNFTEEQFSTLHDLLIDLTDRYPTAEIVGHNKLNQGKACPCFDWVNWLKDLP